MMHTSLSAYDAHYGQELDKQLVGRLCATKAVDDLIWLTWGIPHWREQVLESEPLTEDIWVRLFKHDLN